MEEIEHDIQQRIFNSIKLQLPKGDKLSQVLQDELHISQDASYRRLRGDVPLTIYETKKLCETFGLSFDDYGTLQKGKVQFSFNPLATIDMNYKSYLTGLRDGLKQIRELDGAHLIMTINDTPLFQVFNLPHITRFKFFFWAKTYLQMPEYKDEKFKREKIDKESLSIGIEALNLYNAIPSTEIYGLETLRGTLRQVEYYFDSHLFEDPTYALEIIDNLQQLIDHMKVQAENGAKFTRGNEPITSGNEFNMYMNETYVADNTYLIKWNTGSAVYISHNVMNYLVTFDPYYAQETERIVMMLRDNSSLISKINAKERNKFFGNLERTILNFRRKVEAELDF
ncbi:hypothetical protein K6119_15495 [Paracrocinitomix mangrovi]|uniref:hypothetical protein n=1 Tax=Paracrocinitomix mangrovi TaxID=2862509 RepID=UPI001C8D3814|nr:hypothetical protein [Paracrocinitomix mangrovi]UKN01133.1 hypothetical protein K6119_15495 [Paracrocinitomix mangrovi]